MIKFKPTKYIIIIYDLYRLLIIYKFIVIWSIIDYKRILILLKNNIIKYTIYLILKEY